MQSRIDDLRAERTGASHYTSGIVKRKSMSRPSLRPHWLNELTLSNSLTFARLGPVLVFHHPLGPVSPLFLPSPPVDEPRDLQLFVRNRASSARKDRTTARLCTNGQPSLNQPYDRGLNNRHTQNLFLSLRTSLDGIQSVTRWPLSRPCVNNGSERLMALHCFSSRQIDQSIR
jgi:hypothetical protein